jgi:YidC/Oxa1 family membrane protein insertase
VDRRALLAVALSFLVLFGSNWVFQKLGWLPSPEKNKSVTSAPVGPSPQPGSATLSPGAEQTPPSLSGAAPGSAGAATAVAPTGRSGSWLATPDTILTIEHALYSARFSTNGGRLISMVLRNYKDGSASGEGRAMLVGDPSVALDLGDEAHPFPLALVPFAPAESLAADGRVAKLTFTAQDSAGAVIQQVYRFHGDDYHIDYEVAMSGLPATDALWHYRITLRSWPLLTERIKQEDLNNLGVTAKVGRDNKREMAGGLKKSEKVHEGAIKWLAVHSKYFVLGIIGRNVEGTSSRAALAPGVSPEAHDQVEGTLTVPVPAAGRTHAYTLLAGPLDYWRIDKAGIDLEPPHAMGFNLFRPFSSLLVWVMKFFHSLIHNWGVAILLLAIAAKLVTHPLQAASMRSMRAMQRIQPEVERLRKKHEKDPQKMNAAIMEMYKENKINPLGGCLPMLIQMPFFLALYHVLAYSIDLRQAGFVAWITDLSAPDLLVQLGPVPIRVLPVLMFGSMVLQMKMSPSTDPKQAQTMALVNFVFLFLFYNLPSGLVFYWTVINLFTALQSWHIVRSDPHPAPQTKAA